MIVLAGPHSPHQTFLLDVESDNGAAYKGSSRNPASHERRFILLPSIASVDGCAAPVWFWIGAALAVEGDYTVDDIPAMDASQSWDSASSLTDDLWHSQAGTTGAVHNLSL